MGQGIQDFYNTAVTHGFARDYQLRVVQLGDLFAAPHDNLFVYAKSTSVPSRNIIGAEVRYKGFKFGVPMGVEYTNSWDLTLYCDESFYIRSSLETWQRKIFDEHTMTGGLENRIIQLNLLNDKTDTVMIYRLYGCGPREISEIKYDLGGDGKPQSIDVKFVFQYWTSEQVSIRGNEDIGLLGRITGLIQGIGGIGQQVNSVVKGVKNIKSILGN